MTPSSGGITLNSEHPNITTPVILEKERKKKNTTDVSTSPFGLHLSQVPIKKTKQ